MNYFDMVSLYEKPRPPNFLYKYFPPEQEIVAGLSEGKILLSDPKSFDDIYDARVAFNATITQQEINLVARSKPPFPYPLNVKQKACNDFFLSYKNAIVRKGKKDLTHAKKFLRTMRNGFYNSALECGMTCLAEDWNSEIMWARYAESNRGFVVKFETGRNKVLWDVSPIRYVREYPTIRLHEAFLDGSILAEAPRVPLTKSAAWSDQKEWRAVRTKGPGFYKFERKSVRRIIFGIRCPKEFVKFAYGKFSDNGTKFSQLRKQQKKFEFYLEPIEIN